VILQWAEQISAWINEHFQINIAKQFLPASTITPSRSVRKFGAVWC